MRDRSRQHSSSTDHVAAGTRFRKRFRGYSVTLVDDAIAELEGRVHDLEGQAVELREELLDSQHVASETRHDLTRAKAELRYWNDRASYVDSEVARARQRAVELEQTARERAEAIESDAQERSLQLIDRVCTEANAMLQHAREEAREMFLRFETDVDMSQQKLDKLETVRREVARTMQGALNQFEEAVRELDKVAPAKRLVEQLEGPVRRAVPTFGQQRAMDAALRFETDTADAAHAALSTPVQLTTTTDVEVEVDVQAPGGTDEQVIAAGTQVMDPITLVDPAAGDEQVEDGETSPRRSHDADEEFASLLLQP